MPYSSRLQRAFLLSPPPQRQAAAPVPRGGLFIKPKGSKQKPPHSRAVAFIWKILPVFPGGPSRLLAFGKGGGPGKAFGADVRQRPAQARPSVTAPRRELTAEALRRCVAARAKPPSRLRQGRGVAPQACRLLAFRKAGKVPAKLVAWTRFFLLIRRGVSRRPVARIAPCGHAPRTRFFLSIKRGVSRRPVARIAPCGHPPRGFRPYS